MYITYLSILKYVASGTAVIVFKFLYTSRFEHASAAKLKKGIIVALNEGDNISGLAKEIDLLKDLHALSFNKIARQGWQA